MRYVEHDHVATIDGIPEVVSMGRRAFVSHDGYRHFFTDEASERYAWLRAAANIKRKLSQVSPSLVDGIYLRLTHRRFGSVDVPTKSAESFSAATYAWHVRRRANG